MSRNAKIISEWFQQYSQEVYHFLIYYTGTMDVEDLVQETFIHAFKGLASYKKQSNPKTWIISIARNVAIDEARKRKRKWSHSVSIDEGTLHTAQPSPDELLHQKEEQRELYEAIQNLRSNYRDVIILRGIKEFSVAETAEILDWKEEKVRTNYHRALKSLKKIQGGSQE